MLENERDTFSNECITQATNAVLDAKKMLLDNKLREVILKDNEAIHLAMQAVLAIDDVFPPDDYGIEREFITRYVDNDMMSEELAETLDKLPAYYDKMISDDSFVVKKPEAGYFTSKSNYFIIEASDYIVQRNALYWGQ